MEKYKPDSKKVLLAAVLAVIVLIALGVFLFLFLTGKTSYRRPGNQKVLEGEIDSAGNAHLIDFLGQHTVIEGELGQVLQTADKMHTIVLEENGGLYLLDDKGNRSDYIAADAETIHTVRDNGFVFEQKNEDGIVAFGRYTFDDSNIVGLGNGDFMPADNTLDIVSYSDGEINILDQSGEQQRQISYYDEGVEVELIDISDRGDFALWAEKINNTHYIYLAEDENISLIDAVEIDEELADYSYYSVSFTEAQDEFILMNSCFHKMYTKKYGGAIREIDFNDMWYSTTLYSRNDHFDYDPQASVDSFYVEAGNEEVYNIYYVDKGVLKEAASDIGTLFDIRNGSICYTDIADKLYKGRLKKEKIMRNEQIASLVGDAEFSEDGSTVFYIKEIDYDTYTGTLYCLQDGKEPVKISDNAEAFSAEISADGKTIVYYENVRTAEDEWTTYGELVSCTLGGKAKRVDKDVFRIQPVDTDTLDVKGFEYFKLRELKDGKIICDYYYYNGKSSILIADEVIK